MTLLRENFPTGFSERTKLREGWATAPPSTAPLADAAAVDALAPSYHTVTMSRRSVTKCQPIYIVHVRYNNASVSHCTDKQAR